MTGRTSDLSDLKSERSNLSAEAKGAGGPTAERPELYSGS